MPASRAESAGAAGCVVQLGELLPQGSSDRSQHELGHAVATSDDERLLAEIDQDDLELAAVVAVDRARRVRHRDAMLEREPGSRTNLDLVAVGYRYRKATCNGVARAGRECDVFGG